jgi:hypothetical protein
MRMPLRVGKSYRHAAYIGQVVRLGRLAAQGNHRGRRRSHVQLGSDPEGQRLPQCRCVGMGMRVDQAGQEHRTGAVNDLDPLGERLSHTGDAALDHVDLNIAQHSLAVENGGIGDHKLRHGKTPYLPIRAAGSGGNSSMRGARVAPTEVPAARANWSKPAGVWMVSNLPAIRMAMGPLCVPRRWPGSVIRPN